MSPDPEQEYFCDGMTEEITSDLSKLRALRVISRSSAMTFKGTKKTAPEIAEQLHVHYVLEGSVRKAGNNLRITAQLINAENDAHLWTEKYSGTLDDVFDIQEKVSQSIVSALKLELSPEEHERILERPIDDVRAYECYLRALHEMWLLSEAPLNRALELIEGGLEIVGDNDRLYAMKAIIYFQYVNTLSKPPHTYADFVGLAQTYATKALALNANSAEAHFAQGGIYHQSGNPKGAVHHWERSVELNPNDAGVTAMLGYQLAALGRDLDRVERLLRKATELDPLTPVNRGAPGWLHMFRGEFREALGALSSWQRALEEAQSPFLVWFAWLYAASGDFSEANRIMDSFVNRNPGHVMIELMSFLKHAWLGQKQKALESVTDRMEKAAWWDDGYSFIVAEGYALIGELDHAFRWRDHAIGYGIANVRFLEEHEPFLENLRSDKRFPALVDKARRVSESIVV
jgi:TolB-like protein/tetratricopeptide (TPR) repeat protein